MNNPQNPPTENSKKKNTTLWVMAILFGLPYLAAFYYYFVYDKASLMKSNYGTIIAPARSVPDVNLVKLDNSNFRLSSLKGKWVLFSIASSSCKKSCVDNLYKIRQLKKAVGQDYKRISKLFFLTDTTNLKSFKVLLKDYPGMDVIVSSEHNYKKYLSNFLYKDMKLENNIFLIDPLGNYMMIYPEGSDASKIVKDLERLLKISKIG